MTKSCIMYIFRHGETVWNKKGILQGHLDSPLTPKGVMQAQENARAMKDVPLSIVYSSDLNRAVQTAKIIADYKNIEVETSRHLRERNFGKFNGQSAVKIFEEKFASKISHKNSLIDEERRRYVIDPEIETDGSILKRVKNEILRIASMHMGEKLGIVSHGGILQLLVVELGEYTFDQVDHNTIKNESFIEVKVSKDHMGVISLNNIQI